MRRLLWVMWIATIAVALAVLLESVAQAGVRVSAHRHHVRVYWELRGSKDAASCDGVHPRPTYINGIPFFPYPGDGGCWVKYRHRACYVYEGQLYVQVKPESIRLRFRRVPVPKDLAKNLSAPRTSTDARARR